MTPVEPTLHKGASLWHFGVTQPDYLTLPASVDTTGAVMTEWELTDEEQERLFMGGRIRLWLLGTEVQHGRPLTPIKLEAIEAEPTCP